MTERAAPTGSAAVLLRVSSGFSKAGLDVDGCVYVRSYPSIVGDIVLDSKWVYEIQVLGPDAQRAIGLCGPGGQPAVLRRLRPQHRRR